jgi:hypothetical protein
MFIVTPTFETLSAVGGIQVPLLFTLKNWFKLDNAIGTINMPSCSVALWHTVKRQLHRRTPV